MLTVKTSIRVQGDAADLLKQASTGLRSPREFLSRVGVLGMSSSVRRLGEVTIQEEGSIRSGRLGASLRSSVNGGDTVFELSDTQIEVGSNVPYAAQVHHGGTILPKPGNKALAIPLTTQLKRDHLSPSDIDPQRQLLTFIPITGMKPNVVGVLVDGGKGRDGKTTPAKTPYGPGILFIIAYWVTQEPRPFLFWSEEDEREVQILFRKWIGWAA